MMIWGYSPWIDKAHCFIPMENPDMYISLCKKVVSFTVDPVDEPRHETVKFCFNCLLEFIRKGGA